MREEQKKILLKVIIVFIAVLLMLLLYFKILNNNTIVIGTKNLTEQRLVAYMLEDVIERDTNIEVDVLTGLDSTSFLNIALQKNEIDMYVEYSSSAFIEIFGQQYEHQTQEEIIDYIKKAYNENNISWYTALGFENSNEIVCSNFCKENNITTYSDLNNFSPGFTFAAPVYFFTRSDGYNLLEDMYGFENGHTKNMDPIVIYSAILSDQINTGLAFSTDAKLSTNKFLTLEDDKNAFPKYEAGLVVNNDILNKYPELKEILNKFDNLISTEDIQKMNNLIENDDKDEKEVAEKYIFSRI